MGPRVVHNEYFDIDELVEHSLQNGVTRCCIVVNIHQMWDTYREHGLFAQAQGGAVKSFMNDCELSGCGRTYLIPGMTACMTWHSSRQHGSEVRNYHP